MFGGSRKSSSSYYSLYCLHQQKTDVKRARETILKREMKDEIQVNLMEVFSC